MVMTETELKYYQIKKFLLDVVTDHATNRWDEGYQECAKDVLNKMNPKSDWKPCGEKK